MINHDPPLVNLSRVQWLIIDEADKLFEVIVIIIIIIFIIITISNLPLKL